MDSRRSLIERVRKGDKDARDRLIQENLGLVHHIVRRFENRLKVGHEKEDLFQIGCIGLMKAIDNFDAEHYEVQLSTYAVPLITGEIRRFLRDDGLIKVSRSLKEAGAKIKAQQERLQQEWGREPKLSELSEAAGIPQEEIVMALEANMEPESIYRPLYREEGKESCHADMLPERSDAHEKLINRMTLQQLLGELSAAEQELIIRRYFRDEPQRVVAEALGLTQVQVSRLEKKILLCLRQNL